MKEKEKLPDIKKELHHIPYSAVQSVNATASEESEDYRIVLCIDEKEQKSEEQSLVLCFKDKAYMHKVFRALCRSKNDAKTTKTMRMSLRAIRNVLAYSDSTSKQQQEILDSRPKLTSQLSTVEEAEEDEEDEQQAGIGWYA
jgi:hypothetical protein